MAKKNKSRCTAAGLVLTAEGSVIAPMERVPAPAFALSDVDGKTARLTDYNGQIVVLNFWATW